MERTESDGVAERIGSTGEGVAAGLGCVGLCAGGLAA
ncbi:hypothetical protein J2S69_003033 [Glycomyces lechevalierae]|uniref:Uncharacterized protein n=1 Tax=Glycomyces lechevalierae TaxID=256034 RepID=A0ABU2AQ32_9ACTN|nr:hypothetical protein [Glycomyces lechevalierae]